MRRRVIIAGALAAMCLIASVATAAGAGFASGRWSGRTSAGRAYPISFTVSRRRIVHLRIVVRMGACEFGTPAFDSTIVGVDTIRIGRSGRFAGRPNGSLTTVPGNTTVGNVGGLVISGRLRGHTGTGSFQFFTYGGHDTESCQTAKVTFRIRH